MATIREFFIQRWEAELPAFRRVLAAVPGDKLAYTPHERSTNAGQLAWQLADEQRGMVELVERGETTYVPKKHPSAEEIVKAWDEATEDLRKALQSVDDAKWSGRAKFLVDGNVVWEDSLEAMLWGFLHDMIHHRGQLSTYLRPMGAKVPAIYGPSADDHG